MLDLLLSIYYFSSLCRTHHLDLSTTYLSSFHLLIITYLSDHINSPERRNRHLRQDSHSDATSEVIKHDPSPMGSDGYFTPPVWQTCNDDINEGFSKDKKTQSVTALQYLSHHIRVLLYSGGNI